MRKLSYIFVLTLLAGCTPANFRGYKPDTATLRGPDDPIDVNQSQEPPECSPNFGTILAAGLSSYSSGGGRNQILQMQHEQCMAAKERQFLWEEAEKEREFLQER